MAAGHADTAEIQRVFPVNDALPGLCFTEGNVEIFSEFPEGIPGFTVADTAAANEHRFLAGRDQICGAFHLIGIDPAAIHVPDTLLEEVFRIIVGFAFHILRHTDTNSTGIGRIGQNAHGMDHGCHHLFRTIDAVPIAADTLEGFVDGITVAIIEFSLLQHRVRLAGSESVTREDEQRNAVRGSGTAGGNHVHGAGADGGYAGNDLAAVVLFGKTDRNMGHTLFVVALIEPEVMPTLFQCLTDTDHAAVTENSDDPVYKFFFFPVKHYILIVQEFDDSLSHR